MIGQRNGGMEHILSKFELPSLEVQKFRNASGRSAKIPYAQFRTTYGSRTKFHFASQGGEKVHYETHICKFSDFIPKLNPILVLKGM